jgi:DNA repair protein RecN (Recombination protein N)
MLAELSIKNFAIIDDMRAAFGPGLTTITGETGAGKSILVNAVNLLLGAKATSGMVRTGAEAAHLEALFELPENPELVRRLEEEGHDLSEGLLIQRTVAANNRHRTFVCGRLSNAQTLEEITRRLASICGQHAHQDLLREENHLDILDKYAGLMEQRAEVGRRHAAARETMEALTALMSEEKRLAQEKDLLEFQRDEIAQAEITLGEDEALEQEKRKLKNAAQLFEAARLAMEELHEADGSAAERLGTAHKKLVSMSALDPDLEAVAEAASQALYSVEDAVERLRAYLDGMEREEGGFERVEERLYELTRLKRKYGGSLESVLSHYEGVCGRLKAGESREETREELERELCARAKLLKEAARALSEQRKEAAERLAAAVQAELATLNMGGSRFLARLDPLPPKGDAASPLNDNGQGIEAEGRERARFLISPNVGEDLKPLRDIASGGELSRVVLCLRAILAQADPVDTFIFDEVDAGIGGSTADVVGEKLAALARIRQVICITHLPQIARFGDAHFRISKSVADGRTKSAMELLDGADRVEELARMLAGENVTDTTRAQAMELLERAREKRNLAPCC